MLKRIFSLRLISMCILCILIAFNAGYAADANQLISRKDSTGTAWYDVSSLGVEGKGWTDTESYYDRLPARAKDTVRKEVWDLSHDAAGLCVRFRTDADSIMVAWDGGEGMSHFAPTGVSGVDLYARIGDEWEFVRVGRPEEERTVRKMAYNNAGETKEYILNLPLYHPVTLVEIGVPEGSAISSVPPPPGKPIVIYGTSITQGGCASRPGMAHVAILGRRLNRQMINLGFSGNGRMEPEIAEFIAELDPEIFVIDCIPNVHDKIGELTIPFVQILRKQHPTTPILLVEHARPADYSSNILLREAFRTLVEQGDRAVYLLRGQKILGSLNETVDGTHPTDLGFVSMANAFELAISVLLKPLD